MSEQTRLAHLDAAEEGSVSSRTRGSRWRVADRAHLSGSIYPRALTAPTG